MQCILLHVCMYEYETYGFIHDMLDLWLRHSCQPLRDLKDKYGAIGPHIGVVTARDWSCGLIDHIIYFKMLHVRFAL